MLSVRSSQAVLAVSFLLSLTVVSICGASAGDDSLLKPRSLPVKPGSSVIPAGFDSLRIKVKFADEIRVTPNGGSAPTLTNALGRGIPVAQSTLNAFSAAGGVWYRVSAIADSTLERLRQNAEQTLGRQIANINNYYLLTVPANQISTEWMDQLNALGAVELAAAAVSAAPAPAPAPDYEASQGYFGAATNGVGVAANRGEPGGDGWPSTGNRIKVVDFEYAYNASHADLPPITTIIAPGLTAEDPFDDHNHGTAVFGILGSLNNGIGTTGGVVDAQFYFAPVNFTTIGWSLTTALTAALDSTSAGDFWLIEQQTFGPNAGGGGQQGLVPTEWINSVYDTYLIAVGNGIHIMETTGNGGEDLDDPIYNTGHAPFLPENDCGAVMVGAGGSPASSDRQILSFSNYGSRVDVQGWGNNIVTTGYGDLYAAEGANGNYTETFGGSSGAGPIATSAGVMVSGIYTEQTGGVLLTPEELRSLLIATGSPQLPPGALEHIGPRPDVDGALLTFAARISADTTFGTPPLNVNFSSVTPPTTTDWSWDLSAGGSASDSVASHLYTTPGSHTVSLTIQTPGGTFTSSRPGFINLHSDTLRGIDTKATSGSSARVDIFARNYLPLVGLVIPFKWGGPLNLTYDSAVTTGLRSASMTNQTLSVFNPFGKEGVFVLQSPESPLAADTGAVLSLYFTIPPGVSGSNDILIAKVGTNEPVFTSPYGPAYQPDVFAGALEAGCCVVAGDADHSGSVTIADATYLIARIFSGGPAPLCQDEGDADGGNSISIGDVTYLIAYIFGGGPSPVCGTTGS